MLKNPASMGAAAFGKTRQGPRRARRRARRRCPLQPRRAVSSYDVPAKAWLRIPVPAIVGPELFAAVQEQLRENLRHARQSRRGALYLLQGLVQCQQCGHAYYGKRLSPRARTGHPRAYAYSRCLGTDAYRFGGEPVCHNTQVRTDRLELAVWQEVRALLAHPERLAEEYRRRLHPDTRAKRTTLATSKGQRGKLRQGLARLLDSCAEGLLEKHEFEPRITRLRQRMAHLEAQCQQLADAAALQRELQLIIGRLEDFAAQVHEGLAEADWTRKREMIRTLVKRVEVAHDQVRVVFRVEPRPGDPSPEKKSLQDCRRSKLRGAVPTRPGRVTPPLGFLFVAPCLAPRFLQTSSHDDALALRISFGLPCLERGLAPPSTKTCPAHTVAASAARCAASAPAADCVKTLYAISLYSIIFLTTVRLRREQERLEEPDLSGEWGARPPLPAPGGCEPWPTVTPSCPQCSR
jgi:Recombinase zinc beta ribbon domain